MKIERIRKSHKKEIIIGGLILISIVSAITLVTTRAKYRVTQDIKLAKGTVNYKPYDFKIMAMYQSEDGTNYTEVNEMPTGKYEVNQDKSYCTTDNKAQVKGKLSTNSNGEHIFKNLAKSDKCYVWFDKTVKNVQTILGNVEVNLKAPKLGYAATTDEGIFEIADGMYNGKTSYYWRGAATTNHVIFANKCWRIIRINGDGSIRLIYNGTVQSGNTCKGNVVNVDAVTVENVAYNTSYNQSNYVGWTYTGTSQRTTGGTSSNAKTQTETWYNNNIGNNTNYSSKVVNGYFCNDRNVESGATWSINGTAFVYAAGDRAWSPTLSCPNGDMYTTKAGLLTFDEVIFAGGSWGKSNNDYYLRNGRPFWTMSPGIGGNYAKVWYVMSDGSMNPNGDVDTARDIRLVINLGSNTTFATGGDGTQNSPYVVQ